MTPFNPANLVRCKPVNAIQQRGSDLHRSMGTLQLAMLGVGGTIGTGIFVAFNTAVPAAGPAVIVAFVIAGITAALTAFCYAELSSVLPESGSSYSYAYATLGELAAFMIGACLLLEYTVSGAAVAVGWGQYLNELLVDLTGHALPDAIAQPPGHGGYFNLPAVLLVVSCMILLLRGVRESAAVNVVLVLAKLAVLALFAVIAFTAFNVHHLHPFAPKGISGIGSAAGVIFFSYIGLDVVSTAGDEARDPQRTLPRGIILALLIVTAAYVVVAIAAVGAQPWTEFAGQDAGLAVILRNITGRAWPSEVLSVGAIVSIFSVTLVIIYGQTRILFAMSRDGLLPKLFQHVSPTTKVPTWNTVIVSGVIALLAAFVPLDILTNLTSLGTLAAFAVVSGGVIILRRTRPDLPRLYKAPFYPVLPAASVLFCLYLIASLPLVTHVMFIGWLAAAGVFYFAYSHRRSVLALAAG